MLQGGRVPIVEDHLEDLVRQGQAAGRLRFVVGAAVILIPHAPLQKILILSQVGNGVWLPVVLIFILLLVNRRDLMGEGPVSGQINGLEFDFFRRIGLFLVSVAHDRNLGPQEAR